MNADAKKRYKDIDLPFTCPLTNRVFNSTKGLSVYVTKTLKINHEDYYNNYIHHRDINCYFCGDKGEFISIGKGYRNLCSKEDCVKKSFSSHSVEGFMYRNFCTREEAEILFNTENNRQLGLRLKTQEKLRTEDPLWDKKRSRNCVEFWMKKGYSEDESKLKTQEVMSEIHEKTFKKFKDNPEKYRSKNTTNIEYYIKRGHSEEESKKLLSKRQSTFSKDICIEKYGEVDGLQIWQERQNKWIESLDNKTEEEKVEINRKKLFNNSGYSKISQKLFWEIYEYFKFDHGDIHFEELNSEIIRYDIDNKKHYKYDFILFSRRKCIEFNGDYWHCNPCKYNEDYMHPIMNLSAKDIWDKDVMKIEWLSNRDYDVLIIWESEYKKNPQQTLEKCIKFIND
jgi:hypothetical protein